MAPTKSGNRTLVNGLILLAITSVLGLATWAYADLRGRIDDQTIAVNELTLIVKSSMAIERAKADESQAIKKAAHFHPLGFVGVTYCFPEVER